MNDGYWSKAGGSAPVVLRFLAAMLVGGLGGLLFAWLHSPLPWVLGSMAACAVASVIGLPIQASASTRRPMAAVIGVMLGSAFTPDIFARAAAWALPIAMLPLFLISAALLCVTYFRKVAGFDQATAYFAGMPGGMAEMVLMGAERGADERTIGLIHGTRIFLVVFILPFLIRHFHAPAPAGFVPPPVGAAGIGSSALFSWALVCIVIGLVAGRALRLPAWHLLGPLAVSAALHMSGITDFQIPSWAIGAAQVGLGATIGCRFVGLTLRQLIHTLLLSAGSTAILLAVTIAWALGLSQISGIDPALVTLAYSPGGLAEMSMVALSLNLEAGVVIVHHLTRVVLVLIGAATGFRLMARVPRDGVGDA